MVALPWQVVLSCRFLDLQRFSPSLNFISNRFRCLLIICWHNLFGSSYVLFCCHYLFHHFNLFHHFTRHPSFHCQQFISLWDTFANASMISHICDFEFSAVFSDLCYIIANNWQFYCSLFMLYICYRIYKRIWCYINKIPYVLCNTRPLCNR